jgi:hypothetical protein
MNQTIVLCSLFLVVGCTRFNPLAKNGDAGCVCSAPPANFCVDATTLRSFAAASDCDCNYDHWEVTCQNGCGNGACLGSDPCDGIRCVTPPPAVCAGNTLLAYASGTCSNGACSYQAVSTPCPNGCAAGVCTGDACAGVVCDQPPAPLCVDGNTRRSFTSGGCSGGSCVYTPTDTACSCQDGVCVNDPCSGVLCLQPPPAVCASSTTLQTFSSVGTCSGGTCSYSSSTTTCPTNGGCSGGACVCNFTPCGATCCTAGQVCSTTSKCCTPSCSGKACGAGDGCGGKCQTGTCANPQQMCQSGKCVCTPQCVGVACGGDDGCGGVCLGACSGMCSPACAGNSGCAMSQCFADAAYLSDCVSTGCHALPCKAGYREIPSCFVDAVGESTPLCLRNEITEFWTRPSSVACPTGTHAAWTAVSGITECSSGPAPGGGFIFFEKLCLRDR